MFVFCCPQEIDAITTAPAPPDGPPADSPAPVPTPPRPEPKTDQQTPEQNGQAQAASYNTQYSLAGGEFSWRLYSGVGGFTLNGVTSCGTELNCGSVALLCFMVES